GPSPQPAGSASAYVDATRMWSCQSERSRGPVGCLLCQPTYTPVDQRMELLFAWAVLQSPERLALRAPFTQISRSPAGFMFRRGATVNHPTRRTGLRPGG